MIMILYFARVREQLESEAEQLELDSGIETLDALIARLNERGGIWSEVFGDDHSLMMAVNQEVAGKERRIADGDEIAFFPPVTGG